jgi:hypothetical protein
MSIGQCAPPYEHVRSILLTVALNEWSLYTTTHSTDSEPTLFAEPPKNRSGVFFFAPSFESDTCCSITRLGILPLDSPLDIHAPVVIAGVVAYARGVGVP